MQRVGGAQTIVGRRPTVPPAPVRRPVPPHTTIRILGAFEVRRGTEVMVLPPGLPSQAVEFIAAHGGRVHTEVLIEALWPDCSADEGRKGVRNVLSRLRSASRPLLERDGEAIRVAEGVAVDAVAFEAAADRVLMDAGRPGAADGARMALNRYAGDLLPDERYADWAAGPRERLRRRRLALLDLLAADARRRQAPLEAVHLLELAIEADPTDEVRYLEVAELLLDAGRRGRAATFIDRAREVLEEHGLGPGPAWTQLRRRLDDPVDATR